MFLLAIEGCLCSIAFTLKLLKKKTVIINSYQINFVGSWVNFYTENKYRSYKKTILCVNVYGVVLNIANFCDVTRKYISDTNKSKSNTTFLPPSRRQTIIKMYLQGTDQKLRISFPMKTILSCPGLGMAPQVDFLKFFQIIPKTIENC